MCEALGDVRELAARYDEADAAYARGLEHGGVRARLLRKRGIVAERQGRYEDATRALRRGGARTPTRPRP